MSHAGGGQRQVQKQVQGGAFTKRHLGATLCPRTERHPSALSKILPGKTVMSFACAILKTPSCAFNPKQCARAAFWAW